MKILTTRRFNFLKNSDLKLKRHFTIDQVNINNSKSNLRILKGRMKILIGLPYLSTMWLLGLTKWLLKQNLNNHYRTSRWMICQHLLILDPLIRIGLLNLCLELDSQRTSMRCICAKDTLECNSYKNRPQNRISSELLSLLAIRVFT